MKIEQFQQIVQQVMHQMITDCVNPEKAQSVIKILCADISLEKLTKKQISKKVNQILKRIDNERSN